VNDNIRFLKNTMGMWLLEGCRRTWMRDQTTVDYDVLMNRAGQAEPFRSIIDPDDGLFMNPPDMPGAIIEYCRRTDQHVPRETGEFVRCILESLALKYRYLIDKVNCMVSRPIEVLHIVGGGSRNELLDQFAADATGLPVIAGPVEATAIGNIILQLLAKGELHSLKEARELVARSFPCQTFEPRDRERWNEVYHQKKTLFS
jgi:sugar (pentulose or hexulose) kinase